MSDFVDGMPYAGPPSDPEAAEAVAALRALLSAYDHVFRAELSTTPQQIALSRARAVVAKHKETTP